MPLNTMRTWLRRSLMKLRECLRAMTPRRRSRTGTWRRRPARRRVRSGRAAGGRAAATLRAASRPTRLRAPGRRMARRGCSPLGDVYAPVEAAGLAQAGSRPPPLRSGCRTGIRAELLVELVSALWRVAGRPSPWSAWRWSSASTCSRPVDPRRRPSARRRARRSPRAPTSAIWRSTTSACGDQPDRSTAAGAGQGLRALGHRGRRAAGLAGRARRCATTSKCRHPTSCARIRGRRRPRRHRSSRRAARRPGQPTGPVVAVGDLRSI